MGEVGRIAQVEVIMLSKTLIMNWLGVSVSKLLYRFASKKIQLFKCQVNKSTILKYYFSFMRSIRISFAKILNIIL